MEKPDITPPSAPPTTLTRAYDLITGDEDPRVCADIPDSACRDVPVNFFLHLAAQIATKTGDQLASARLVLAWLMATLGAPAFMTGLLVPIRESLALLPQLAVAGALSHLARRKWVWVAGSLAQGLCVMGMALVAAAALSATRLPEVQRGRAPGSDAIR